MWRHSLFVCAFVQNDIQMCVCTVRSPNGLQPNVWFPTWPQPNVTSMCFPQNTNANVCMLFTANDDNRKCVCSLVKNNASECLNVFLSITFFFIIASCLMFRDTKEGNHSFICEQSSFPRSPLSSEMRCTTNGRTFSAMWTFVYSWERHTCVYVVHHDQWPDVEPKHIDVLHN